VKRRIDDKEGVKGCDSPLPDSQFRSHMLLIFVKVSVSLMFTDSRVWESTGMMLRCPRRRSPRG
jgi:hypothetical protein